MRLVTALGSLLVMAMAAGTGACASQDDDGDGAGDALSAAANTPGFLNGWRPGVEAGQLARDWYTTPQGSHLLDFETFMHLRTPSGDGKFADRANLEKYGFLYPEDSVLASIKKDGLPLGVVRDDRATDMDGLPKGSYVGFTCSGCHTGIVKFKGEKRFVHAGTPVLDHERFMADLQEAVHATTNDPPKKAAFCGEVKGCDALLAAANARIDDLRSRSVVPAGSESGPGRLDAISHILNEVFGHQLKDTPGSVAPVQVPISLPPVWNAARLDCVQTNCLAKNSLSRNVGEVLGVFGDSEMYTDAGGRVRVRSTAKVENLDKLEQALDFVTSPKWDPALFGAIDAAKAQRGGQLFAQKCAGCHAEPYKSSYDKQWQTNGQSWDGAGMGSALEKDFSKESYQGKDRYLWRVTRIAFDEVGTDSAFVLDHAVQRYSQAKDGNEVGQAVQVLNDKIADNIAWQVRSKTGAAGDLFGALAELHGSDRTIAEKAAIDLKLPQIIADETNTDGNPTNLTVGGKPFLFDGAPLNLRKTDGSVMTLVLLGAVTASAVDSYFLDKYPSDSKSATASRDKMQFFRAPPEKGLTLNDFAVYRARPLNGVAFTAPYGHAGVWPTLRSVLFPSERPASFFVGSGDFDPKNVGVDTSVKTGFQVDTTKPGSTNKGHEGSKYGTDLPDADKLAIIEYLKSI